MEFHTTGRTYTPLLKKCTCFTQKQKWHVYNSYRNVPSTVPEAILALLFLLAETEGDKGKFRGHGARLRDQILLAWPHKFTKKRKKDKNMTSSGG